MRLATLIHKFHELDFPSKESTSRPARELVRMIQDAVACALGNDAFKVDCAERELLRLEREVLGRGLVPFHEIAELGIRLAMGYWAPGQGAGVHEHTDWTVTAVCHNQLEVSTFDRELAFGQDRIVQKSLFQAPAGRVGHIYDPCIHEPRNPTASWSVSLHIVSPHDGRPASDGYRPFIPESNLLGRLGQDHPFARCVIARQRQEALGALTMLLLDCHDERAPALLEGIFARTRGRTRRLAGAALASKHPAIVARSSLAPQAPARVACRGARPELEVRMHDGFAYLLAMAPWGPAPLLQVGTRGAEALRTLALERDLVVGELPGDLDEDEKAALVEELQWWGLFMTSEPTNNATRTSPSQ